MYFVFLIKSVVVADEHNFVHDGNMDLRRSGKIKQRKTKTIETLERHSPWEPNGIDAK
ncbi:hypothetical protein [Cohnella lupini]|nr:hypothetical protein [Cohnella lupini]